MDKLVSDLTAAADSLPIDLPVQTDALDESDAPVVIVERERIPINSNSPLQLGGNGTSEVFIAFPSGFHWSDIEQVAGAFVNAYKDRSPATNIDSIELGRGASDLRLVKLQIETGTSLDLEDLPSDFRYSY